jgi:hypothetical protein
MASEIDCRELTSRVYPDMVCQLEVYYYQRQKAIEPV